VSFTGDLYVGMRGPGATITFTITKPAAFSGSFSAATRSLTVQVTQADGTVASLTAFTWADLTTTGGTASVIPDGTEFTYAGKATAAMAITLDGTVYDFKPLHVVVKTLDLVA